MVVLLLIVNKIVATAEISYDHWLFSLWRNLGGWCFSIVHFHNLYHLLIHKISSLFPTQVRVLK